jgi:hypothetical protein
VAQELLSEFSKRLDEIEEVRRRAAEAALQKLQ